MDDSKIFILSVDGVDVISCVLIIFSSELKVVDLPLSINTFVSVIVWPIN